MNTMPKCPECGGEYTYQDGHLYICPTCFYEWTEESQREKEEANIIRDPFGNEINDGDEATINEDLKLGSDTIKRGTKVTRIQILDVEENGHDIQGNVQDFGRLLLKSSVIKNL